MNAGFVKSWTGSLLVAVWSTLLLVGVSSQMVGRAAALTPEDACAADSLYLISPASLDVRLETVGKPGVTLSWPNLDQSQATCFSLDGADTLGFGVSVSGGFGDIQDRLLGFSTENAGLVGGQDDGNITMSWASRSGSGFGILGGQINLANNGGLWSYGPGGWEQVNNGLPMTWPRTNIVALGVGSGGFMVAGFSGGTAPTSSPKGLYAYNGTNWAQVAPDLFHDQLRITAAAVSPLDNDSYAVGTDGGGLYVTTDGGATFTQWTDNINPQAAEFPTRYLVQALNWDSDRLLVFMPNWGLYASSDVDAGFADWSFLVPASLDDPNSDMILPSITDFAVDPTNSDRIVAALLFHGAYETLDAGATWHGLNGDLVVADPEEPSAWINSGVSVLIDPGNPQIIVMAVKQKGLYRTADGGATWILVGDGQQPANRAALIDIDLLNRPGVAGEMLAMEDKWKLLHSTDSGQTWSEFSPQPVMNRALVIAALPSGTGEFIVGTNGGGIYEAGTSIHLADTYTSVTSPELRDLDLGLDISFDRSNGGLVKAGDSFELVAQTFQGWAVWRGPSSDPQNMKMIGLFDRVNPEDCYAGFCGDNSLEIIPNCYRAKRAACFDLSDPDTLRFFDEEIYNGFSYLYAVTTFDYGNVALLTPQNNTNEMLMSPRFTGDKLSIFTGPGNRVRFDVNEPAAAGEAGDEIYAYPNPVRLGAGVPRGEGSLVVFTNLPEGSRVRVFTTAGDDVINLGPDNQSSGQMYWNTVNRDGEDIAAGVYLYKVEMPHRDDYWGRIVVIR